MSDPVYADGVIGPDGTLWHLAYLPEATTGEFDPASFGWIVSPVQFADDPEETK